MITGITNIAGKVRRLYAEGDLVQRVDSISAYLAPGASVFVNAVPEPIADVPAMVMGAMPRDGGYLIFSAEEYRDLVSKRPDLDRFLRRYVGSVELTSGGIRRCLWIADEDAPVAAQDPDLRERLGHVSRMRAESSLESTRQFSAAPHRFVYLAGQSTKWTIGLSAISTERREYLPVDVLPSRAIASNKLFALYDAPLWTLALICSRLHLAWIAAVCGRMRTDYSYSNTLGWNTFPLPTLTEKNKADLTLSAESILLTRESHFPATIADLYDPDTMPGDLRAAHDRNDEVLERIYIGRRFRNDTERLEKLFDLYTKITGSKASAPRAKAKRASL